MYLGTVTLRKEPRMEKPTIIDKRPVRLEDVTRIDYIPFLGGRPNRETIISRDDITNISILLNTTSSVSEFLEKLLGS